MLPSICNQIKCPVMKGYLVFVNSEYDFDAVALDKLLEESYDFGKSKKRFVHFLNLLDSDIDEELKLSQVYRILKMERKNHKVIDIFESLFRRLEKSKKAIGYDKKKLYLETRVKDMDENLLSKKLLTIFGEYFGQHLGSSPFEKAVYL